MRKLTLRRPYPFGHDWIYLSPKNDIRHCSRCGIIQRMIVRLPLAGRWVAIEATTAMLDNGLLDVTHGGWLVYKNFTLKKKGPIEK